MGSKKHRLPGQALQYHIFISPDSSYDATGPAPVFPVTAYDRTTFILRSGEVEAVQVHHLVPCSYKVIQKLLPGVLTCIDFRQGPQL